MHFSLANFFAFIAVLLTEAWLLHGYFKGEPAWDAALAFVAAIGAFLTMEPIKAKFGLGKNYTAHDRELFRRFLIEMPSEPTINFAKEHDFGNSFRSSFFSELNLFVNVWSDVENEFLAKSLQEPFSRFYSYAKEFTSLLAQKTVPVGDGSFSSVFSDRLREAGSRPPFVIKDAQELNSLARDLVTSYEAFVRHGRKELME